MSISRTEGDINISPNRKKWHSKNINEQTRKILDDDEKYFIHQSLSTPCLDVIEEAEGICLVNSSGKKIMDFHGNNVHQIGFRNQYVIDRLKSQMDKLPFSTRRYTNEKAIELAKRITELTPVGLDKVLFAPGGTTAVGLAIKLARYVSKRHKMLVFWDSFHGASLDAISAGGESLFRADIGPLMPGVEHVPPPTSYRGILNDGTDDEKYADYIQYVVQKEGDIGMFVFETIRNTDVQIPSKSFWQKVRKICDDNNIILILDEIPIAFGRTGKMFAYEHFGIEPDILVLGKGLGAGIIPMAAIVARNEYDVAQNISLGHYTFEKNPLGAEAGLAMLDYIEKEKILAKMNGFEILFHNRLNELKNKYQIIGDVRGIGLLWGIELVLDRNTKEKATDLAEKLMYYCLENGLSFKVSQGNVIQLSPPLIITKEQANQALAIIENGLKYITENYHG
jgi:4-aminobutyrate aminotransferase